MKKIIILLFAFLVFTIYQNVLASETLVLENQNNPYYYRVWSDKTDSNKLTFYNLNGEVVYCVEPGVDITDHSYVEIPINNLEIGNDILEKIKLIGYYGYEYPNHQTNNYRMATQALIWENIRNLKVSFWTGKNQTGNIINVDNEKNEIMRLVNNHYLVPNISNSLNLSYGIDNVISDNNYVLENFEIINNNADLEVYKTGNDLHIKSNKIGDYTITLRKIKYDNKKTLLYMGSDSLSQKLMKLRFDDNIELKINIHINGGKILLKKLNSETKDNKKIGTTELLDAVYGIYDNNNILIEELRTNESGEVISNYLKYGNYYLKEITPSYGYLLDLNKYEFIIDENNLNKEITVLEDLIKKDVQIIKTLEGEYSLLDTESNITFDIYDNNNNELYQTITTNNNGVANIKLPYGEFLFHQVNTNEGYLKSDDFVVLINHETEEIVKVIYDKRVRGQIKIIKIDSNTNEPLENALIEIYKDDNLIYTGYTDKNGIIELNDLYVGEYKIKEIKAPNGYILDNQIHIVYITNSSPNSMLEIKNKHEEINVPNTSLNSNNKIKYSSFISFIIGFILIIISRKKYKTTN